MRMMPKIVMLLRLSTLVVVLLRSLPHTQKQLCESFALCPHLFV